MSPTIGLYFYAEDYVKFCSKLEYYLEQELKFIDASESSHTEDVKKKKCPIGKLDDIEIVFLHYKSEEEAFQKWERRKERINMKNIEYYGAAEPPVRCGESHLSGLTEPPHFVY